MYVGCKVWEQDKNWALLICYAHYVATTIKWGKEDNAFAVLMK